MDKRYHDCALTIAQEEEVCSLYRGGTKTYALADRFGISQGSVMRTLRAYKVPTSRKRYSYDESFFDVIDTEAKAYFLGLLTADGYVCQGPKRYVVQLYLTDRELVEGFRDAIGSNQPIYEIAGNAAQKTPSTKWMLAVGSKRMVESLARYGVVQAKTKREVFTDLIPESAIRHYMRGLFDGDGSCGIYNPRGRPQVQISLSGSEHVVSRFSQIVAAAGGIAHLPVREAGGRHVFCCSDQRAIYTFARFIYDGATIFLERKRAIFTDLLRASTVEEVGVPALCVTCGDLFYETDTRILSCRTCRDRVCERCGTHFPRCYGTRHRNRFCSKHCHDEQQRADARSVNLLKKQHVLPSRGDSATGAGQAPEKTQASHESLTPFNILSEQ